MQDLKPQNETTGLARPALAVQLSDALRNMILEGELPVGEKVREKMLTERFGVSRTPLREAMKVLAAEGLIELIPNRGAIVSRHSIDDLLDVFPVLAALERLAGELAAELATEEEINNIIQLTVDLEAAAKQGDRPHYFEINQTIHGAILTAAGNETLSGAHATISGRAHRARYQANLARTRWEKALEEHARIASALQNREGKALGQLLHDHMMAKLSSIRVALQEEN